MTKAHEKHIRADERQRTLAEVERLIEGMVEFTEAGNSVRRRILVHLETLPDEPQ